MMNEQAYIWNCRRRWVLEYNKRTAKISLYFYLEMRMMWNIMVWQRSKRESHKSLRQVRARQNNPRRGSWIQVLITVPHAYLLHWILQSQYSVCARFFSIQKSAFLCLLFLYFKLAREFRCWKFCSTEQCVGTMVNEAGTRS